MSEGSGGGVFAAEGDFDGVGVVAGGEDGLDAGEQVAGQLDVVGGAGLLVVKVGVGLEVGAVSGGAALKVDLPDEVALHEGFEAVVNGGEGDGGHLGLYAGKNLVGGGMVALGEEGVIDHFALRGVAQAAVGEALREGVGTVVLGGGSHGEGKSELESFQCASWNWNHSR